MLKRNILLLLLPIAVLLNLATTVIPSPDNAAADPELVNFSKLLIGDFNSSEQASKDTSYFHTGEPIPTYGYNGALLGPTLVLVQGQSVTLNVTNLLPDLTTTHWHGLHVSPENDGGPHSLIYPNTTWSPSRLTSTVSALALGRGQDWMSG